MWSFPGSYANRGSRTEQASSDVAKERYFDKTDTIVRFRITIYQSKWYSKLPYAHS